MNSIAVVSSGNDHNYIQIDVPYMAMVGAGSFFLGYIYSSLENPTYTFSGWDSDLFAVQDDGRLILQGGFTGGFKNYSHELEVTATDSYGNMITETFQVSINDRPDPEYFYTENEFVVYSSEVKERKWSDFTTVVNDIKFYDYDPEKVDPDWIVVPSSWMNSLALPTVLSERAGSNIRFDYGIKDIMTSENPSFIEGVSGSLKAEFEKIVLDAKSLGAENIEVIQWTSGKIENDGTHSIYSFSSSIFPLQYDDLEHLVEFAEDFGIGVTVSQQIQYYTTQPDETGYAVAYLPEHTSENVQKWMDAYKQHIISNAYVYEAMGINRLDITNGSGTLNFVFDDGTNSDIYINGFRDIIRALDEIFTGEIVLLDSFLIDDEFINANIDAVLVEIGIDLSGLGLSDNEITSEMVKQSIIESGKIQRIEELGNIFPEIIVTFSIQSRSDAFTNPGYVEETMCTSSFHVNEAGVLEEQSGCMQLETEVDFALQARAYHGVLSALNLVNTDSTITFNSKENWITENILGSNVFPNIGGGARNKPAETLIYEWLKCPIELELFKVAENLQFRFSLDESFDGEDRASFKIDFESTAVDFSSINWQGSGYVNIVENSIHAVNINIGSIDLIIETSTIYNHEISSDLVFVSEIEVEGLEFRDNQFDFIGTEVEGVFEVIATSKFGNSIDDIEIDVAFNYGEFSEIVTMDDAFIDSRIGIDSNFFVTKSLSKERCITSQDALEALRLSVGMDTSMGTRSAFDYISADFNQDGRVTSADALSILRYAVGLETEFEPEWIFINGLDEYNDISRNNVSFSTRIDFSYLSEISEMFVTGILVGDVNDSFSGSIA